MCLFFEKLVEIGLGWAGFELDWRLWFRRRDTGLLLRLLFGLVVGVVGVAGAGGAAGGGGGGVADRTRAAVVGMCVDCHIVTI